MKKFPLYITILLSCLILSGCSRDSDSDKNESFINVYRGINKDENDLVVGVQIILETLQTPLLTLSDDRDHLVSYSGTLSDNGDINFIDAQYFCSTLNSTLLCKTKNSDLQLENKLLEPVIISDFQGLYTALWSGALYEMQFTEQGGVVITGESCHLSGELSISSDVEQLVLLDLTNNDCGLDSLHAYAFLSSENESLYSLDLLTPYEDFPISWVRSH